MARTITEAQKNRLVMLKTSVADREARLGIAMVELDIQRAELQALEVELGLRPDPSKVELVDMRDPVNVKTETLKVNHRPRNARERQEQVDALKEQARGDE